MPDIHHLGLFIAAGLLLNLTPGPDVLYIVTHALRSGARAGAPHALHRARPVRRGRRGPVATDRRGDESRAAGAPAQAQVNQDGLVNVNVGDVTILEDVNVGVAAAVAANICGVKVGPVAVLGQAVDRSGATRTVCESDTGDVTITQN